MRLNDRLLLTVGLLLVMISGSLSAEVHTLTDQQGRTIKADVISVENDIAKIKREDGITFNLPLSQLAESDQKTLREWAKAQALLVPAGAIEAIFGRSKFKSTPTGSTNVTQTYSDGTTQVIGKIKTTSEEWGYSVTLKNKTSKALSTIRIDYILFVKPDNDPGNDKMKSALTRKKGSFIAEGIKAHGQSIFKTDTIQTTKTEISGDITWSKTGGTKPIKDTLYGIWARIFVGDQLISEISTPDTLMMKENW